MQHQLVETAVEGGHLHGVLDAPDNARGLVLIVHGCCDHYGRYDKLATALVAAGFGVLRFDQRGYGRNHGPRGAMRDFRQMLDDIDSQVGMAIVQCGDAPLFVVGHSLGGLEAAVFASKFPTVISGYVFASPFLTDPHGHCHRGLGLPADRALPMAQFSTTGNSSEAARAREADPLMAEVVTAGLLQAGVAAQDWIGAHAEAVADPVLMITGAADGLVPPAATKPVFDRFGSPDKTYRCYEGLGHNLYTDARSAEPIKDTVAWIQQRAFRVMRDLLQQKAGRVAPLPGSARTRRPLR